MEYICIGELLDPETQGPGPGGYSQGQQEIVNFLRFWGEQSALCTLGDKPTRNNCTVWQSSLVTSLCSIWEFSPGVVSQHSGG